MKKITCLLIFISLIFLGISPKFKVYAQTLGDLYDGDDTSTHAVFPPAVTIGPNTKLAPQLISEQNLVSALDPANQPNVIFIITDDQPPGLLGLSGNTLLKTPNIDSLADKGVYFRNMYLPLGVCEPSRAAIWTGRLPHSTGVIRNELILPTTEITLPEILQANGYATALIGKCTLGDPLDPTKYKRGFDQQNVIVYPQIGAMPGYDFQTIRVNPDGSMQTESHTGIYPTDYYTDESLRFITEKASQNKPFFLWLAHTSPHQQIILPPSDRYKVEDMSAPASMTDDLSTKPPQQANTGNHTYFWDTFGWDKDSVNGAKAELHAAYESMSNIDDNVGRIISKLNELGIRDKTIIIYMSDNGLFYGEHQLMRKGAFFYNEQMKSPFIFSYPKITSQKKITDALSESIDILPTLLDILTIPTPVAVQGTSFKKILTGETQDYRRSVFMEYHISGKYLGGGKYEYWDAPMRGIFMYGFKWVHYNSSTIDSITYDSQNHELYNLAADPYEMTNILKRLGTSDNPLDRMLKDPTYGKIIQKLRKELAIYQTDTHDPFEKKILNFIALPLTATTIQLSWLNDYIGSAEIEFVEANCQSCQVQELNNFNYTIDHKETLSNLKPNSLYNLKIFSIGPNGNGGYVTAQVKTQNLSGDINGDGKIDILDLARIVNARTQTEINPYTGPEDVNGDTKLNATDLADFLGQYSHL